MNFWNWLKGYLPFRAPDLDGISTANNSLHSKRRLLKDTTDFVEYKKRKFSSSFENDTVESDCEIIDVDDMTVKTRGSKRNSLRLKENNLSSKRSTRMVEMALESNKSNISPVDTSKIYCIDDDNDNDDDNESFKRSNEICRNHDSVFINNNYRTRSQTRALSFGSNQDSKNFTPTLFSSRPFSSQMPRLLSSSLCLSKVRKEQGQKLMMQVVLDPIDQTLSKNNRKEKSLPLLNSTLHNTKQNQFTVAKHPYTLRSSSSINPDSITSIPNKWFANLNRNQDDSPVLIDLTKEDDDESQRKAIEEDVLSSASIRNYKSTFLAKNRAENGSLEFNSLLRKYDKQDKQRRKQLIQIEKQLKNRNAEMYIALEDVIKHRLSLKDEKSEEEEAEKPPYEIRPITKEMQMEIRNITMSRKDPLVQIKDTAIKIQDIKTLENTAWLNDEVINAYMNLIKLRSETYVDRYPKVYCFNTFLYEQLSRKGYNSVRRWTRKVDIFDFTILIVPIHLGNHWTLVQIRFDEKFIRYYDSMGSPNNRCLEIMGSYLIEEYADKKKGNFDLTAWKFINVSCDEIPQQRNAYDCGVFACTYAEYITRNARLNFDQEHMGYFRVKMMYEILTGKLLL